MTRVEHDHLLDGRLHDVEGCPMCVEIRSRMVRAKLEAATVDQLDRYRDLAERAPRRRGDDPR